MLRMFGTREVVYVADCVAYAILTCSGDPVNYVEPCLLRASVSVETRLTCLPEPLGHDGDGVRDKSVRTCRVWG